MAKNPTVNPDLLNDEDGWETESEESAFKVSLDTTGDKLTGIKVGQRTVQFTEKSGEEKSFVVYQFRTLGMTSLGLEDGTLVDLMESYRLAPLAEIPDGKLVRITRMRDVPVSGRPEPMKDYKIESRAV